MSLNAVRVFVVRGNGWEGIYVNGELIMEDAFISLVDMIDLINKYNIFHEGSINYLNGDGIKWLKNRRRFPYTFAEIPFEYFGH